MKVLIVHNYHSSGSASGDDQVFKNECQALKEKGVIVYTYSVINDEFDKAGILGKVLSCINMFWSKKTYKKLDDIIKRDLPEIIHVHTFFPLISPSVFKVAKDNGIKVIQTIHDTRYICPNASSLRNGHICNDCITGHYMRMCRYKCFKGSRIQSFIVALIFSVHRKCGTFYKYIDRYICLNKEQMGLMKKAGFDEKKLILKYNFVEKREIGEAATEVVLPERYVVFYGRIGEEKGVQFLCDVWENMDIPIVLMGDGPLKERVLDCQKKNPQNVIYLGYVPHKQCSAIVSKSEFVVMPSIWYEGCSMVIVESFALGKPVIATNLGFMKEAVHNDKNGYTFELGNKQEFVQVVNKLWNNTQKLEEMREYIIQDFSEKYEKEKNIEQLIRIYGECYGSKY